VRAVPQCAPRLAWLRTERLSGGAEFTTPPSEEEFRSGAAESGQFVMAFTMQNWEEMQNYVGAPASLIPHREYDEATGQVRDVFDADRMVGVSGFWRGATSMPPWTTLARSWRMCSPPYVLVSCSRGWA
jgi:hypothetical protein